MLKHLRLLMVCIVTVIAMSFNPALSESTGETHQLQGLMNQNEPVPDRPIAIEPIDVQPIPNLVIVKLRSTTEKIMGYGPKSSREFGFIELDEILQQYSVQRIERTFATKTVPSVKPIPDLSKIYSLHLSPGNNADLLVESLNSNPFVEYAERFYPPFTDVIPNDPLYSQQIHFDRIMAESAWSVQQGDSTVIVAIIDTGVDWNHEDLGNNIWSNSDEVIGDANGDGFPGIQGVDDDGDGLIDEDSEGRQPGELGYSNDLADDDDENGYIDDIRGWDFVDVPEDWPEDSQPYPGEDGTDPDNDPSDFDGHGTHTAGIASAVTDNGIGIAGTGWETTIMPVRSGYLTAGGVGSIAWGYNGIVYAADNGADIISLSWGGSGHSQMAQDVIDYAWGLGAIIIAAAGNNSSSAHHYPAAYDHVMAVAATGTVSDNLASFSNYGTWVDICAPGTSILSTLPNNTYGKLGGTSMSTPMVAGAVALVKVQYPTYTNHEVLMQLAAGADNIDNVNQQYAGLLGYGRLNMYEALTTTEELEPSLSMSTVVSDTVMGDGDGILEPGETVHLIITLENQFLGGSLTNLNVVLNSEDYAITIQNNITSFSEIQSLGTVTNTSDPFVFSIESTSIPHRAGFTLDITGDNGYHEVFTFAEVVGKAPILLVDDDDGSNNVENYYFDSLDSLGIPYVYWSHLEQGTPAIDILNQFRTLIWFCEWTFPALDSADRAVIGDYLNNGGHLFLSGQDIGWDLCDAATSFENEYFLSNGASLVWYESNLHAEYIADDATPGGQLSIDVSGLNGNAIGDGLEFTISQPGRDADNQYPSIIAPLGNAESIFEYSSGGYGANLWSGAYNVVNLAFGYEAIMDETSRFVVMDRVLKWLNDFSIGHEPLSDTENTTDPRSVSVQVFTAQAVVDSVAIYWSLDGNVPFNIEPMSESSPGVFIGDISAQDLGTTVYYFIFAMTENDFFQTSPVAAPLTTHSYYVGIDTEPPVIASVTELIYTIDNSGTYTIESQVEDNIGVDHNTVFLHYRLNNFDFDSTNMTFNEQLGLFSGNIDFGGAIESGDTVSYFVSAYDLSAAGNRTDSPVQQFEIVSTLVVDDFESGVENWLINQGWEPYFYAYSGAYSITESPTGFYGNDSEYILKSINSYNLSSRSEAYLSFWHIYSIADGDSANVEISTDGLTWDVGKTFIGSNNYVWEMEVVSLEDYVGMDNVHFRFRITTDESGTADGWYIDDIVFYVDTTLLAIDEPVSAIPLTYALKQNYPNPFNPTTTIEYQLPQEDHVKIVIYNLKGQVVRELVNQIKPTGIHTVRFDATTLASGVYFYRIKTTSFIKTKKLVVLK